MEPVRFVQIGLGGYGGVHTRSIRGLVEEGLAEFLAAADPLVEKNADRIEELRRAGVRHYTDYIDMLDSEQPEAVSVATPIHLHREMILAALERGRHVLVEKPPVVLIHDLDCIAAAAEQRGLLVQTGFQNIVDEAARDLKSNLVAGRFGSIRRITVFGLWQRLDSYYERANWAGRLKAEDRWVLDGPLNNPLIHYIHEGLFLAGVHMDTTARPLRVQAELYRAHQIEGEDTACIRSWLEEGPEMLAYLTLCASDSSPATVRIDCDDATITWQQGTVTINCKGHEATIEKPEQNLPLANFRNFVRAIRGEENPENPLSAARNVILHNNGCYLSSGAIHNIPGKFLKRYDVHDSVATEIAGIHDIIQKAATQGKLFSEMEIPWANSGKVVELNFVDFDPSFLFP